MPEPELVQDDNGPTPPLPAPAPVGGTPEFVQPLATIHLPSMTPPTGSTVQASPKRHRKGWLLAMTIIVVLVAAGVIAAAGLLKSSHKPITTTKKDIPLLSYGLGPGGEVPHYPVSYLYVNDDIFIALQLFEGLVGYQDQTKIVPLLATSWSNPNDTTWVFNLRQGVKFHSGRTMTAQDVKYSLDYAVAHQNDASSTFFITSTIKQVDVTGPYQVTITTQRPDPVLLNRLSILGIIDSKAKLGDYNAGTGPYTTKPGTTPTASSIDLVASNDYWGGHVYTREVNIKIYSSQNQLVADAASGKLDLAGEFSSNELPKIKAYQTIAIPDQGLSYMGLNTVRAGSALQSLAARQAIAYALNVPAILKAGALKGQQASQIVPLLLPGHNAAIQNTPYDPIKAKQLLASVKNADSALTFAYPSEDAAQAGEMIKELTAAGFNIKPISISDFAAFINDTTAGKYDIFIESDTSATVDGLDILNDLLEGNQDYDSPQIDKLITQASGTLSPAARINDMQQVAVIVAADKPIIPLYNLTRSYVVTKPYVVKPDLPSLAISAYLWKVYQK